MTLPGLAVTLTLMLTACAETEIIAPTLGSLRVESSMSGTDVDRDGVIIAVDDTTQVAVASTGTYTFTGLVAGPHQVRLTGITPNCATSGSLQRTVTVGSDTAVATFTAVCEKVPLAPNGLIAFARGDSDHTWDLWVMNGDGTGETKLRDSPGATEFQPAWTRDGQYILFTTAVNGGFEIARINRQGTGFVTLATSAYSPSVSPDSQHIVFVKEVNAYDIWLMNIDGTNQHALTTDAAYEDHPTWSPDGSQIVFERGYRLYVMNADGSNAHSISTADAIEDRWPTWSPDGTKILFTRRGFGQDHVFTIRPDGTGLTPLTSGLDNDDFPTWSADGAHILFSSGRGGILSIWSMRADGSGLQRLSLGPPSPYDSYPASSR
jgi:Tol biopolymer transport system component